VSARSVIEAPQNLLGGVSQGVLGVGVEGVEDEASHACNVTRRGLHEVGVTGIGQDRVREPSVRRIRLS
jgi:hypothetical protein